MKDIINFSYIIQADSPRPQSVCHLQIGNVTTTCWQLNNTTIFYVLHSKSTNLQTSNVKGLSIHFTRMMRWRANTDISIITHRACQCGQRTWKPPMKLLISPTYLYESVFLPSRPGGMTAMTVQISILFVTVASRAFGRRRCLVLAFHSRSQIRSSPHR